MLTLDQIRRSLAAFGARQVDAREAMQASVSLVLRHGSGHPEMLFIERAHREGDPWSGHMAFPGGRVEPGDLDRQATAVRETAEEVGLDLSGAEALGRLDDLYGGPGRRRLGVVLSAYVFLLEEPSEPVLNHEVETALWVPLGYLHDRARHLQHLYPAAPDRVFSGILVGEPGRHVVWGLTLRLLEAFFDVVGRPLRVRPGGTDSTEERG